MQSEARCVTVTPLHDHHTDLFLCDYSPSSADADNGQSANGDLDGTATMKGDLDR